MNKDEYMKIHDRVRELLSKKYGGFLYFLCVEVLNLSQMEKVVHGMGYKTVRKKNGYSPYDFIGGIRRWVYWIHLLDFRVLNFGKGTRSMHGWYRKVIWLLSR